MAIERRPLNARVCSARVARQDRSDGRRRWCWSRSGRRSFSRAPTGFGPTVERWTPSSRCGSSSTRPAYMSGQSKEDVEDCFGSIHQGLLMEQLRRRVTDKRVLRLIRQFLAAGIMRHGSLTATPSGTPQGAILSPGVALTTRSGPRESAVSIRSSGAIGVRPSVATASRRRLGPQARLAVLLTEPD